MSNKEDLFGKIPLQLVFRVARTKMEIGDLLKLGPGAVIELDKRVREPLDIVIENKRVGTGEVVKVGENYGVRIKELFEIAEDDNE